MVFKGSDKLSVKFEFNTQEDTPQEVVAEMIEEQVLPERYQQWITSEIHRIIRDIEKEDSKENTQQAVWRRENDIRSELEKSKLELSNVVQKVVDFESKCEQLMKLALLAEEKELQALAELEKAIKLAYHHQQHFVNEDPGMVLSDEEDPQQILLHLNKVVYKGSKMQWQL